MEEIISRIANNNNFKKNQVKAAVDLLDDGNTIPFIARYRKEMTGNLDEEELRLIEERLDYIRKLNKRKEEVIRLIDEQDKLTEELEEKIKKAEILQEVEDLYRPYKQKKQTRATKAKEKGLEPLAEIIWEQKKDLNLKELSKNYIDPEKELNTADEVLQGANDIIAEWISDNAEIRKKIREISFNKGSISSTLQDEELDEKEKYKMYYDYKESVSDIPPHRILALNRGEKEEKLKVKIEVREEKVYNYIENKVIINNSPFKENLIEIIKDAYKRLIFPSIEREVRNKLTDKAEEHAIEVFGKNLRSLLLQPPYKDEKVVAIDPGFRTGSKVCAVDETGKLLDTATIYPHPPQNEKEKAKKTIKNIVNKHNVNTIAIGSGTASRETEFFISELIDEGEDINYIIVNEDGASVYSASKLAREEFPELDVAMRGAVSIARRLQDPLAELVKIDPKSIGVGLYQHDVDEKKLNESLENVVESAVNYVGVNLNTASPSLLQYVAGINSSVAENIVEKRKEEGSYNKRSELKDVYGLGPKTFKQAAGFIRIFSSEDPLARTPIHPESYKSTEILLKDLGFTVDDIKNEEKLIELKEKFSEIDLRKKAKKISVGLPTLKDIIKSLKKPGRDPRPELSAANLRDDILKLEDLKPDMILEGTVRNVVDFGAFVDIGVKEDGLVHISEMSSNYVKDPMEIVQVGDIIKVKILEIDKKRKRIALSMIL
ncbi:MAG TPA: Tex family protein [Halanaerobiales bacterium]|nr:Tex family protein [Halanaerobiales bacterium]